MGDRSSFICCIVCFCVTPTDIAVLTLFRCTTGESWNGLMHDCINNSPDSMGRFMAVPFFISWQILAVYLLQNIFTALIIGAYQQTNDIESGGLPLLLEDLRCFSQQFRTYAERKRWWHFWTPSRSAWLRSDLLLTVLTRVQGPLGLQNLMVALSAADQPSQQPDGDDADHKATPIRTNTPSVSKNLRDTDVGKSEDPFGKRIFRISIRHTLWSCPHLI